MSIFRKVTKMTGVTAIVISFVLVVVGVVTYLVTVDEKVTDSRNIRQGADIVQKELRGSYLDADSVTYEVKGDVTVGERLSLGARKFGGRFPVLEYKPFESGMKFPIVGKEEKDGLDYPNVYDVKATYIDGEGKEIDFNYPALVQYRSGVDKPTVTFTKLGKSGMDIISGRLVNPTFVLPKK